MEGKAKNLGSVAAMVSGKVAPNNKKILWYDENVTEGCPIRYYDITTKQWTLLTNALKSQPTASAQIESLSED